MTTRNGEIDTPTLRAALVAVRVMTERPPWQPTTAEVAAFLGMEHSAAFRLMARLSRVLRLYQDDENRWRRAEH